MIQLDLYDTIFMTLFPVVILPMFIGRISLKMKIILIIYFTLLLIGNSKSAQNPSGLVLNEVFTFGQQRNIFTNGRPYIELYKATNHEVHLDKYSLVTFSLNHMGMLRLRAVMDLSTRKFNEDQNYGVLGDGPFENKLHEGELKLTPGILLNENYNSLDFLSIGNKQYLITILLFGGGEYKYEIFFILPIMYHFYSY